jgi:hypothetical protein
MRNLSFILLFLAFSLLLSRADSLISVKDFGAKGDGISDDTPAVKKAIESAPENGIIYFPPGKYRIKETLELKHKTLLGNPNGAWNADADALPVLIIDHLEGPAIHAYDAASINGLCFQYEHKPTVPQLFAPTILLSGVGINISNIKIHGCYDGIIADGKSNVGRLKIRNVFIAQCHNTAIYITRTYDVATLELIHIWSPASPTSLTKGVGIKLGRNDEIHLSNCFVFHTNIAYLFETDEGEGGGSTYGTLINCATDYCSRGYVIRSPARLNIIGGNFLNHHASFYIDNKDADLRINGVLMQSNGEPCVWVKEGKSLNITGSSFRSAFPRPEIYSINVEKIGNLLINACDFDENAPAIKLGKEVKTAIITNNIFPSSFIGVDKGGFTSDKWLIDNNIARGKE